VCGRFVQTSSVESLAERFEVAEVTFARPLVPDYNVTPRADVPIVRERARDDPPTRVLSVVRWGLVPSWAKSPSIGDRQINARAESITERPAYRRAMQKRRCIVPADAFYEWKKPEVARAPKTPYAIRRRDGDPLALAGLWEIWRDRDVADDDDPDAWLRTCAIVTTDANEVLAPIHDRMPVVLDERDWDTWLDPRNDDMASLVGLLRPAPGDWFDVFEVSSRVSRPENNDPGLLEPVAP
jgi:putative SOS response-associated peptidase YedK